MNTETRPAVSGGRGRPAFGPPAMALGGDRALGTELHCTYKRVSVAYFEASVMARRLAAAERQIMRLKLKNARLRSGSAGPQATGDDKNDEGVSSTAGAPGDRSATETQERKMEP